MRLLLIEDDPMVGRAMREGLVAAGFAVDWVRDGLEAEAALVHEVHDLAVLDLGLPGKDGMQLLRALRQRRQALPVIIASARDAVAQRIAGLEAGADDYVLKPFDLDELVARIRAVLRRHAGQAAPLTRFGALTLDPQRKTASLAGEPVELSAREWAIMEALMRRPGAVLSRQQLEESVYAWGDEVASNAIEVHLHNLRKKLGSGFIRNVRGVGWRITA